MGISILGFKWGLSSSFHQGAADGPTAIKEALNCSSSSPYSLDGTDVRDEIKSIKLISFDDDAAKTRKRIEAAVQEELDLGNSPLSLGGDHSISYPILKALKNRFGPLNILHIDAHPDLYDELDGDEYSHACPFRRAFEDGCINQLIQVGIRSATPEQRSFAADNNVLMLKADEISDIPFDRLSDPLYISIDLDGLDPAFAPGVSHNEPGGLSTREVLQILATLNVRPIGADIVELNPTFDINKTTAYLAARLAKELVAMMR